MFQCSASCGEGYKHRRVFCVFFSDVSYEVNAKYCDAAVKPADKERCFIDFCYGISLCASLSILLFDWKKWNMIDKIDKSFMDVYIFYI